MKRLIVILYLLGFSVHSFAQLLPNLGGQRAGISALTFLKMDVSPRAAAMGGAQIAVNGDAFAAQWNPAALTDNTGINFAVANTFWHAGINHAHFAVNRPDVKIGNFGFNATALTTGAMEKRTELQPNGTGEYFYAYNLSAGLTYAKQLTDMFSYGLTIKYVNETLDNFVAHTGLADLGFLYRTDFKDLKFAISLTNFGPNSKLNGKKTESPINNKPLSLQAYPAPTVFSLGVSMIPWKKDKSQLLTTIQLNHPGDNAENIRLGLEFCFRELLYFRAGYKLGVKDQPYPTAGIGLRMRMGRNPLMMDYAVDPSKYLGWAHRIGLSLTINKAQREQAPAPVEEVKSIH